MDENCPKRRKQREANFILIIIKFGAFVKTFVPFPMRKRMDHDVNCVQIVVSPGHKLLLHVKHILFIYADTFAMIQPEHATIFRNPATDWWPSSNFMHGTIFITYNNTFVRAILFVFWLHNQFDCIVFEMLRNARREDNKKVHSSRICIQICRWATVLFHFAWICFGDDYNVDKKNSRFT